VLNAVDVREKMNLASAKPTVPTIAYSIRNAVAASGISRSKIYELISKGKLDARKDGRKTLILASSLDEYIHTLPAIRAKTEI
jgi:excisionase family DNA binding protein